MGDPTSGNMTDSGKDLEVGKVRNHREVSLVDKSHQWT